MSTISGGEYLNSQATTQHAVRETSRQTKTASQTGKPESEDTVEISREARDLLDNQPASGPWKPWSVMEYETPLVSGSKEEKEFRELMKSVKSQKSEIMSQVTEDKKDTRGKITTWKDGIDIIGEQLAKLKKIKEGNFNPTRP